MKRECAGQIAEGGKRAEVNEPCARRCQVDPVAIAGWRYDYPS